MKDIDPVEKQHAIEVLDKALEILGPNGEHWTKEAFARDKNGKPVDDLKETAVCFCSTGAVHKAVNDLQYTSARLVIDLLNTKCGKCHSILRLNDGMFTTFADVKRVFLTTREKLVTDLS